MTSSGTSASSWSCELISSIETTNNRTGDSIETVSNFGWKNKAGETVVYEGIAEIVRIAIFAYANNDESCEFIAPGKITIIYYEIFDETRVILQPTNDTWPLRNERVYKNNEFDYDGWLWRDDGRNRMCKNRHDLGDSERIRGFIFGDWNYYGVSFRTEAELLEFKNAIGDIQRRISDNGLSESELKPNELRDRLSLRVSRFWCDTGLRMSNLKLLFINLGSVWRINGSYSVEHDGNGIIALTLKKNIPNEILEMLVIFRRKNREDTDDVKKCYSIPANFRLVSSHITPENKKDLVWEWAIGCDTWASAFRSFEDGQSFKKIIDFYVSQFKKSNNHSFSTK